MFPRTRLALITGAALLTVSWLAAGGVATASSAPSATVLVTCDGLAPTIVVPAPNMVTFGGGGNDVILGTFGVDTIHGLGGDDHICGLDGNDTLTGGDGHDRIFGNSGDDVMFGGDGKDRLDGGPHIEGDRGDGGPAVDACPNTEIVVNCP